MWKYKWSLYIIVRRSENLVIEVTWFIYIYIYVYEFYFKILTSFLYSSDKFYSMCTLPGSYIYPSHTSIPFL